MYKKIRIFTLILSCLMLFSLPLYAFAASPNDDTAIDGDFKENQAVLVAVIHRDGKAALSESDLRTIIRSIDATDADNYVIDMETVVVWDDPSGNPDAEHIPSTLIKINLTEEGSKHIEEIIAALEKNEFVRFAEKDAIVQLLDPSENTTTDSKVQEKQSVLVVGCHPDGRSVLSESDLREIIRSIDADNADGYVVDIKTIAVLGNTPNADTAFPISVIKVDLTEEGSQHIIEIMTALENKEFIEIAYPSEGAALYKQFKENQAVLVAVRCLDGKAALSESDLREIIRSIAATDENDYVVDMETIAEWGSSSDTDPTPGSLIKINLTPEGSKHIEEIIAALEKNEFVDDAGKDAVADLLDAQLPPGLVGGTLDGLMQIAEFFGYKAGDANGDGFINSADGRLLLRCSAKLDTLDNVHHFFSDVTCDGKINSADARIVLRMAAKLPVG